MLIGQFVGGKGSMYQSSPVVTNDKRHNTVYKDYSNVTQNKPSVEPNIDEQLRLELQLAAKYCKK